MKTKIYKMLSFIAVFGCFVIFISPSDKLSGNFDNDFSKNLKNNYRNIYLKQYQKRYEIIYNDQNKNLTDINNK